MLMISAVEMLARLASNVCQEDCDGYFNSYATPATPNKEHTPKSMQQQVGNIVGRVLNWLNLRHRVLTRAVKISKTISGASKKQLSELDAYLNEQIGEILEKDKECIKNFCNVWTEVADQYWREQKGVQEVSTVYNAIADELGEDEFKFHKLTPDIFNKLLFSKDALVEFNDRQKIVNHARVSQRLTYVLGAIEFLFKTFISREGSVRFVEAEKGTVIGSSFNNSNNKGKKRLVKALSIPYSTGHFIHVCVSDKEQLEYFKNHKVRFKPEGKVVVALKNTCDDLQKVLGLRKTHQFQYYFAIIKQLGLCRFCATPIFVREQDNKSSKKRYFGYIVLTSLGRRFIKQFIIGKNGLYLTDKKLALQYRKSYYSMLTQKKKFLQTKKQDREDDKRTFAQVRGYGQYFGEVARHQVDDCLTSFNEQEKTIEQKLKDLCAVSKDDLDLIENIKEQARFRVLGFRTKKIRFIDRSPRLEPEDVKRTRKQEDKNNSYVDPPIEPQVEPPIEPQVEPPIEPQVDPPGKVNTSYGERSVWHKNEKINIEALMRKIEEKKKSKVVDLEVQKKEGCILCKVGRSWR